MNYRKGKEKLAEFKGTPLKVDWDDLLHYRGRMFQKVKFEKSLGKALGSIGFVITIGSVLIAILSGNLRFFDILTPDSVLEISFWLGMVPLIYGLFLSRDQSKFAFNLETSDLHELSKEIGAVTEIELDNYLGYALWATLDKVYFQDEAYFLLNLTKELWNFPSTTELILRLGVDGNEFKSRLEKSLLSVNTSFNAHYLWLFSKIFNKAVDLRLPFIDEKALFVTMAETVWKQDLLQMNVTQDQIRSLEMWITNDQLKQEYVEIWRKKAVLKPTGVVNRAYTSKYAPTLEQFGQDYTRQAARSSFNLTIGREREMQEMIKILQKDNGAALVLIGDPGVGKTQLLKHLGVRMVVEDVPKKLQDQRLVAFNFNKAFAQIQSFESFKLTLQNLFEEVAEAKNIVLVLDDMDQLLNVRADLQAEIVNILANGVNKYNLRVIGTASLDGYNRFIKPIRAVSSMFQSVLMYEPNALTALQILIDEMPTMESKYGIKIQIKALKQIVDLAPKFDYERVLPDKAIDLLEESLIEARDRGLAYLSADAVSEIISRKVGAKVGTLSNSEAETLIKLEEKMHGRVVGQDSAVTAVAAALRRARAGLQRGSKPLASFLFFGPTGVGKTEVAKTLTAVYYGDEKLMVRVDMSEYQEEENLTRLIGKMDGNKFVGGYLTDAVRSRPFSLVLLDEIEKANPKVLDLFLQILDEGFVTDGSGRKVDFSNTIIICTSNAGSREIAELILKGKKYDEVYNEVLPVLQQVFRIEFLNRFDKVIMFKPLLQVEVQQIADRIMQQVNNNLMEKGIGLQYTEKVLEELVQIGYNPIYGAREVKRIIQERLEDTIAQLMIQGKLRPGSTVKFETLDNYQVV